MYDNPLAIINGHAPELIKVRKISKLTLDLKGENKCFKKNQKTEWKKTHI